MNRIGIRTTIAAFTWIAVGLLTSGGARAQEPAPSPSPPMDRKARHEVLDGIIQRYRETYIDPEVAKQMERSLRKRERRGEYDRITDGAVFADTLTAHLRQVSHDTHVEVHFSARPLRPMEESPAQPETPERVAQRERDLAWINNGFVKVERLRGNVGLIDLDGFADPASAGATAAAAMSFLSRCDALIVDLRYNTGGYGEMAALLCSYLLPGEPVHLVDIYFRPEDFTKQSWTSAYVEGPRFLGRQVYVVTSKRTHSAAEEFAYSLQAMKRAVVVGEVTRGGAHPTGRYRINEHFGVSVPKGRAVSAITKTNWEGSGVKPDVEIAASEALKTAHLLALEHLMETDPQSPRSGDRKRVIEELRAARTP